MSDESTDILSENGIDLPDIAELEEVEKMETEKQNAEVPAESSESSPYTDFSAISIADETEAVDESLFTGKKEEKTETEALASQFQEQFTPKQVGSIAKYTEPVGGNSGLEVIIEMFKSDPNLEAIPVEEDDKVVGFIDRKKIVSVNESVWKRITASNVIEYVQRVDMNLYANDYIEKVLKKVSMMNRKYGINYFPVFNGQSFYGIASLDDFLDRTAEIRTQDLAKASVIQQSFFPHYDLVSELPYSFHYWNKMANELGGDLIQVYKFSEKKSLICCFDVSGKNVAASLLTIAVGAFFGSIMSAKVAEKNPVRLIAMLDDFLASVVPSGNFITGMLCYVDEDAKKICLFNCGHTTTYLIKKSASEVASVPDMFISIDPKLPPLGMGVVKKQLLDSLEEPDAAKRPYVAYNLRHGLHLNMYSDGLTDMMTESGNRFEDERAKDFFKKLYDMNDDEVEEAMGKVVESWIGQAMLPDDVTILDIRF